MRETCKQEEMMGDKDITKTHKRQGRLKHRGLEILAHWRHDTITNIVGKTQTRDEPRQTRTK